MAVNLQATYKYGICDFCKQRDVEVLPLDCKRHFYCKICSKFAPKFQRKDFQCRTCSERFRKFEDENLKKVDNFLETETGGNTNEGVAVCVNGGSIITFSTESSYESDEYTDLKGNNDEWEHLLTTLTRQKEEGVNKAVGGKKKKKQNARQRPISFIKQVLHSDDCGFLETVTNSEIPGESKKCEHSDIITLNELPLPGDSPNIADISDERRNYRTNVSIHFVFNERNLPDDKKISSEASTELKNFGNNDIVSLKEQTLAVDNEISSETIVEWKRYGNNDVVSLKERTLPVAEKTSSESSVEQNEIAPAESTLSMMHSELFEEEHSTRNKRKQRPGWMHHSDRLTAEDDDDVVLLDIEGPPESPIIFDEVTMKSEERDAFWD